MGVFKVDAASLGLLGDSNWLSIVSVFDLAGRHETQFMADSSLQLRQSQLSHYIRYLHEIHISTYLSLFDQDVEKTTLRYVFQGEDCSRDLRSVSWQSQRGWKSVCLVPDLYYFHERGYEDFLPEGASLPAWSVRQPTLVWRGSTTGVTQGADLHAVGFAAESLDRLPRYRMCRILQQLGDGADVGIVAVVQCPEADKERIVGRLTAEGLTRDYMAARDMVHSKFLVDIDGNTNSWNFIQRLRLGCCILKVESPWIQWFSHRVQPWVHYVPVEADLSDLLEKVEWCRTHDRESELIAGNGRRFGLGMRFEAEMRQAALDILRTSTPLGDDPEDRATLELVCASADRLRSAWNAATDAWPSFPEPTWLRTVHDTILGSDDNGRLIQLSVGDDLTRAITLFDGDSRWPEKLRGLHIECDGDLLSLKRAGLFLCALEDRASTVCDRLRKREWETFTPIPARAW